MALLSWDEIHAYTFEGELQPSYFWDVLFLLQKPFPFHFKAYWVA